MMRYIFILILFTACSHVKPINNNTKNVFTSNIPEKPTAQKLVLNDTSQVDLKVKQNIPYPVFTKENSNKIKIHCDNMNLYFKKYDWGISHCHEYTWHHVRNSYLGNPITWFVFGDDAAANVNTTMIFCGVHGDEITPVKFCFDILNDLRKNPSVFKNRRVVIAPLVTPDAFLKNRPTRANARGVDVNRNFPTKDWAKSAIRLWKKRYRKDKRRYPGKYALSEQETIFQVNLIKRYKPNKIISIHSPLTLLDYDGPTFGNVTGKAAKKLLVQMSDSAGKYKVSNYPFFTGSLGNWAGNERKIPTYTLELPNSDWHKTDKYFKMFRTAIHQAIKNDLSYNRLKKKVSNN